MLQFWIKKRYVHTFLIVTFSVSLCCYHADGSNSVENKNHIVVSKEEALEIAKKKGALEGFNIKDYRVDISEEGAFWYVHFNKDALYRGGDQHFSVRVNKSNKNNITLFKGR